MKKFLFFFVSVCIFLFSEGQNTSNLIRHDTTILRADESQWLLPKDMAGRSVPAALLDAIASGQLKAFDSQTNQQIPSSKIFTWRQSADTMIERDVKTGRDKLKVIQHEIQPGNINRIRIYYDWLMDPVTNKIQPTVRSIELLVDIYSYDGSLRGYTPLCRIE